jgi:hypothetical protein
MVDLRQVPLHKFNLLYCGHPWTRASLFRRDHPVVLGVRQPGLRLLAYMDVKAFM